MIALTIILSVTFIGLTLWFGYYIYSYIEDKYDYNIFSIKNMVLSTIGTVSLMIPFLLMPEISADNKIVLVIFSSILYISLLIRNLTKVNLLLSFVSLLYQFIASFAIIIIIYAVLPKDTKKRRY